MKIDRDPKKGKQLAIEMEPFIEGKIEPMATLAEETEEVELYLEDPSKMMTIGANLPEPIRTSSPRMPMTC